MHTIVVHTYSHNCKFSLQVLLHSPMTYSMTYNKVCMYDLPLYFICCLEL